MAPLPVIILTIMIAIIIGATIGIFGVKLSQWITNRLLKKHLREIIEGKRKNQFEHDGKMIEVNRFKVTDATGQDVIIDLTGRNQADLKQGEAPEDKDPLRGLSPEAIELVKKLGQNLNKKESSKEEFNKVKPTKIKSKKGKKKKNG